MDMNQATKLKASTRIAQQQHQEIFRPANLKYRAYLQVRQFKWVCPENFMKISTLRFVTGFEGNEYHDLQQSSLVQLHRQGHKAVMELLCHSMECG